MKPGWTVPAPPTPVLPRRIPHGPHPPTALRVSPLLLEAAGVETDAVLEKLRTSKGGLSEEEAARRSRESGPNVVARDERHPRIKLLRKALLNPLVFLLVVLAASSFLAGDLRAGIVILVMVAIGVIVR